MARRMTERMVRVATEPFWRRDVLEMRAVDAVVSKFEPKRRSDKRSTAKPRTAAKRTRRDR